MTGLALHSEGELEVYINGVWDVFLDDAVRYGCCAVPHQPNEQREPGSFLVLVSTSVDPLSI